MQSPSYPVPEYNPSTSLIHILCINCLVLLIENQLWPFQYANAMLYAGPTCNGR